MNEKQLTGTNSPGPRYSGPMAPALNSFLEIIFGNDRLNYTAVLKSSMGIFNSTTGYYDEESCLYSMQTNQSDIGFASLWYPVQGKNLKSHPFYRSDIVKMFSAYRVVDQTYDSDVMGVFADAFTPGVWLTVALSCFVFWLMIKTHVRMRNKMDTSQTTRDDSLYEVLTHLFQVETIDYKGACMKAVSLFASVLSFVVIGYFTCSMKTDIVVVQDPDLINSYDDLLTKPNIRMMFSGLSDTFSKFESADPQSKERRAYERSLKFVGGDRRKMIIHPAGMDILQVIDEFREIISEKNRRTVACLLKTHARGVRNLACYLKVLLSRTANVAGRKNMNFYAWMSQDPDVKENILTLAYSAFYKSPYLKKVQKRMKWFFAMGFENLLDRFANILPVDDKMKDREEGDTFRNCKADDYHHNLPHVECSPFAPVQFKSLTITCGVLLALSVVAVVREKYNKRPKHPKFGQNKVAVVGPSGVTDQEGQSDQSGRNDAPVARVLTAIEVVEREEAQDTLNLQSRAGMAASMDFSRGRDGQKVELSLHTTAGPSEIHRSDKSLQSSWKNATWQQKEPTEIEVFDQRQETPIVQPRVLAPSMKFSRRKGRQKVTCEVEIAPRPSSDRRGAFGSRDRSLRSNGRKRSDLEAEMWNRIRSRDQPVKWKVTRV